MSSARQHIRVTQIGEYIRHRSCDRRFKLEHNNRELPKQLPFAERLFNALDPVLQEAGRKREEEWEESLRGAGLVDVTEFRSKPSTLPDNDKATPWSEFASRLDALRLAPGQEAYGREVSIGGSIGVFDVEGRIDFIVLRWRDGRPVLLLVESKASRRDRTYHRMQVATYQLLVQQTLTLTPLTVAGVAVRPDDVECVVARIDENTNLIQAILDLDPLNLDTERADIERLLAPGGAIEYIVNTPLPALSYQLNEKCDGCVFNVHCFPETARERRLELLGIEPASARVLRAEGVTSLDDLVGLDLSGSAAGRIRSVPSFTDNLERLQALAKSRSKTLPGGSVDPDAHEVEALPHAGQSQLPEHTIYGHRLVRIYLSVAYDYVENRIGALTAHVTKSDGMLHTGFVERDDRLQPDSIVRERRETGRHDAAGHPVYDTAPLQGQDVIEFKASEWTGRYDEDTGAEREMLQSFLRKLIEAIAEVAEEPEAPIHFYVWSRSEIAQLVEACSRVGSGLLSHLRELLGCRESLEQLIYSCLQSEIDRRYALGWTSRGLAVATSLRWYGRVYHWRRRISGVEDYLDRAFTQDIFDFKTTLDIRGDGTWARNPAERAATHRFEIRSRFHDSLSAPYWRAYWRTLPDPSTPGLPRNVRASITRYNEVAKPGYFREYLRARVHALRWIEEGVRFKNAEIEKPLVNIGELQAFTLGVHDTARAAVDFLRLDQHVSVTDWIASHLVPPATRVPTGRTIPLGEVVAHGNNRLTATIDLTGYDIDYQTLEARCTIGEGSFVRLTPCYPDPHEGQTFGQLTRAGSTCIVDMINWQSQQVALTVLPYPYSDRYILQSFGYPNPTDTFFNATLDESPSDFVAGRVDERLGSAVGRTASACRWLDPTGPDVPTQAPLTASDAGRYRSLLGAPLLPGGRTLAHDQANAAFDGLEARIQLLQGPPGTGKTTTSSVATLLRILARRSVGDIVLIAAHTHTAIDNLLLRISELLPSFRDHATRVGAPLPELRLTKVLSSDDSPQPGGGIEVFLAKPSARFVSNARRAAVLVIGGTTGAVLKMAKELGGKRPFVSDPERFKVPTLIIDEASMMVFPHFLGLATLVRGDGEIMLTGDHRQLSPIVAHDWDREDRPPVLLYQPFVSAYESVLRIKRDAAAPIPDSSVRLSSLTFTFRLPPVIRGLIGRLYQLDNITLDGPVPTALPTLTGGSGTWHDVWDSAGGLYLVMHSERESKQSNEIEIEIIERILQAGGIQPDGSIAIVTPHRAQRSLLRTRLATYSGPVDVIDTVERLQGGEKPTVIVSATASDPAAISAHAEFILNLNRSNVAFTRTQRRLIVVCAETLLDHIPAEIESYESTMLWKSLRALCTQQIAVEQMRGHTVRILTPPISHSSAGHPVEAL